ncbi:MAG TPA: DnaJ domain-containing protein [Fimbriimonas sp.]
METLTSTYYEVLGVGPKSDPNTIRKAYRLLASRHHPDVSDDPHAHENMARINEAFETLIDAQKRNEYDATLAGGGLQEERRLTQKPVVVRLKHRLRAHKTPIYAVAFTPDTGQLVSSAFDNEILWWDEEAEKPLRRAKLEAGVVSTLRPLPNDRMVAAGSTESILTLYRLDGAIVDTWKQGTEEWASCIAISSDGQTVAAGSIHRALSVNRTRDGGTVFRNKEHEQSVTAVCWSHNGRMVATGSADATVRIYDARSGEHRHTIKQIRSTVTALAFSHDNKFLAVAAVDLSIRVFSLETGKLMKMVYGHSRPIEALAFHPNNWLFASASRDGTIGLWNAAKGIGNVRIEASSRPVVCVAFSPDGTRLAAAGQDKLVRLFEVTVKEV